ncbi:MAG: NUDIX hydrolase [Peptococcia bacterium]
MTEKFIRTIKEVSGKIITYKQEEVLLSNGNMATRDIVLHDGAVGIVAITKENEIILVRQYRYAAGEDLYEIPAGKLEKGEEPLPAAKRELSEETGYRAETWHYLTSMYSAPGFCSEKVFLYYAEDLTAEEAHPDEDELIEYQKVPIPKALEMIGKGEIKDAKSIAGILLALRRVKGA